MKEYSLQANQQTKKQEINFHNKQIKICYMRSIKGIFYMIQKWEQIRSHGLENLTIKQRNKRQVQK